MPQERLDSSQPARLAERDLWTESILFFELGRVLMWLGGSAVVPGPAGHLL